MNMFGCKSSVLFALSSFSAFPLFSMDRLSCLGALGMEEPLSHAQLRTALDAATEKAGGEATLSQELIDAHTFLLGQMQLGEAQNSPNVQRRLWSEEGQSLSEKLRIKTDKDNEFAAARKALFEGLPAQDEMNANIMVFERKKAAREIELQKKTAEMDRRIRAGEGVNVGSLMADALLAEYQPGTTYKHRTVIDRLKTNWRPEPGDYINRNWPKRIDDFVGMISDHTDQIYSHETTSRERLEIGNALLRHSEFGYHASEQTMKNVRGIGENLLIWQMDRINSESELLNYLKETQAGDDKFLKNEKLSNHLMKTLVNDFGRSPREAWSLIVENFPQSGPKVYLEFVLKPQGRKELGDLNTVPEYSDDLMRVALKGEDPEFAALVIAKLKSDHKVLETPYFLHLLKTVDGFEAWIVKELGL